MNNHAIKAFTRYKEAGLDLDLDLHLSRLASSILSKLAKYSGWEDWVFRLTTWSFHSKSLIPNGLVKLSQDAPPSCLAGPEFYNLKLGKIEVNLLDFYAMT